MHSEKSKLNKGTTAALERIRTAFCATHDVAEELIPIESLAGFYKDHGLYALMRTEYPEHKLFVMPCRGASCLRIGIPSLARSYQTPATQVF